MTLGQMIQELWIAFWTAIGDILTDLLTMLTGGGAA